MSSTKIGQVISSAPNSIMVEIVDLSIFENFKIELQIGRYLKIAQGNNDFTIAVIMNLKGVNSADKSETPQWQFLIECQAIGTLVGGDKFERGTGPFVSGCHISTPAAHPNTKRHRRPAAALRNIPKAGR